MAVEINDLSIELHLTSDCGVRAVITADAYAIESRLLVCHKNFNIPLFRRESAIFEYIITCAHTVVQPSNQTSSLRLFKV